MAVPASTGSNPNLDGPPLYDVITKSDNRNNIPALLMSDIWNIWMGNFFQTLLAYLSQNGILLPQMTQAQRDLILTPIGGQMIYNLDINLPQVFIITSFTPLLGDWKTFTVT